VDSKTVAAVTEWMNGTDLSEVAYYKKGEGFEIRSLGAQDTAGMPVCPLSPVASPAIGVFRMSKPGRSESVAEGQKVEKGQTLGFVEMGRESKPVCAHCGGFVRVVCVEDGKPVQFGQPVVFVEPA